MPSNNLEKEEMTLTNPTPHTPVGNVYTKQRYAGSTSEKWSTDAGSISEKIRTKAGKASKKEKKAGKMLSRLYLNSPKHRVDVLKIGGGKTNPTLSPHSIGAAFKNKTQTNVGSPL